jgi:hypothetical protein
MMAIYADEIVVSSLQIPNRYLRAASSDGSIRGRGNDI